MAKYLSKNGLTLLAELVKNWAAPKDHTHDMGDFSGTVPVSKGGTGATTAANALTNLGLTATAAELNKLDGLATTKAELGYLDGVTSNVQTQLNGKAASNHTHSNASATAAGFLPKLGGGTTNFLRADGTWAQPPNTTYGNMTGATSSAAGKSGLVPAPAAGAATRYLRSDGTWQVPPNTTYTLGSFGITATATELNYLDGVTSNVQTQLNGKAASSHNHSAANITSGTLAVGRGGTGLTASPSILVNLGSTSATNVLQASPRPGITGTLPISHGGTGSTTASGALSNLGAASASQLNTLSNEVDSLRDSVSRVGFSVEANTGLANYSAFTNSSFVHSGMVTLQMSIILSTPTDWNSDELRLFTLPSVARPNTEKTLQRMCFVVRGSTGANVSMRGIRIKTNGDVMFMNLDGGTQDVQVVVIPGVSYSLS